MQKPRFTILTGWVFVFSLTLHSYAFAAAWLLDEGDYQIYNSLRFYQSSEFLDQSGKSTAQPEYNKHEIETYFEYGLSDELTLGTQFSLYRAKSQIFPQYNLGISDPSLFLRHALWKTDNTVISVQPLIKFHSFSRDDTLARSGTDAMNLEMRFLAGHSLKAFGQYHFANAEAAYRKRFEDFNDQLLLDITLGMRTSEKWMIMPQLFSTWRLSSNTTSSTIQIFDNDYDAIKGKLSVVYQWNDSFSTQLGAFYDLWGQNTGRGKGITLTTGYKF